MSATPNGRARPRANAEEIIKATRRRTRAASSRRRALMGEPADGPITDGALAVAPAVEPIEAPPVPEAPEPKVTPKARPQRRREPAVAPDPIALPKPAFVSAMLALVAAGILGLLLLNTVINENAFQLQEMRQEQTVLNQTEESLTNELAQLNAPGNLQAAADEMGMEEPEEISFLHLPDGTTVNVRSGGE
ncbi:hypothetical protein [Natronoglycomyces albus]|uniref:Cell division protein FtsL n=1 Tax=Natronoglycomyces albus TaxID=2811108 RepID=A0A895XF11_9ACTN|nr:hypothetical protein [Natronoglycomyces albus]QSB03904.1 hypothetical protein JQS30_08690 [Natronoglycomyces albus]